MIECKFSLDLTKNGTQKTIYAKAGEQNARKMIITLTHSGSVFLLQTEKKEYSAKVFLENGSTFDAEVVGNTVHAVIPNAFAEPQIRVCELRISHGSDVIFSPMFELIIEESLGNKAESESLQVGVRYQESLADIGVQEEKMQDEDYVVIYDSSKGTTLRLPWSEMSVMIGKEVITHHYELSGRNEENQHEIKAITGLQKALDSKASVDSLDTKADKTTVNGIEYDIEWIQAQIQSQGGYFKNEITRVEEFATSGFEDVYQRLDNLSVNGGLTQEQIDSLHTHSNKSILDDISDENGVLTYKGKEIEGKGYELTDEDKTEITNAVIEALPKYNGEVAEV